MKQKTAIIIILAVSIAGILFSGYLSYYSLFTEGCTEGIISCGSNSVKLLGLPTCLYGLIMYLVVAILSFIGLKKLSSLLFLKSLMWIGIIGVLFSGSLSYYELYVQETTIDQLPACVYGLIMYALILVFAIIGAAKKDSSSQINNNEPAQ